MVRTCRLHVIVNRDLTRTTSVIRFLTQPGEDLTDADIKEVLRTLKEALPDHRPRPYSLSSPRSIRLANGGRNETALHIIKRELLGRGIQVVSVNGV